MNLGQISSGVATLLVLLFGTLNLFAARPQSERPNVLFIAIDDLKPLLGCYGARWIKSPAIDRLAERATVFKANYCQIPLCAPTRASLLTGLCPDSTGVYFNPFKVKNIVRLNLPDVITLPQHFKSHGYVTRAMGKVFDARTVDEGHDGVSWSLPYIGQHDFAPMGPGVRGYQNPDTKRILSASDPAKPLAGPPTECWDVPDNAYFDGAMARSAVKQIEELAKQPQPFFLAVGFIKPHLPFIAPKKYWDLYDRNSFRLAPNQSFPDGSPAQAAVIPNSGELRDYAGVAKTGAIPQGQQRELIHGYAACVSYIDAQVALLLETLKRCGIADKTIVCVWGDNGWHLGELGHWGKSTNYEDATRTPLIICAPGIGRRVRTGSLSQFLDVYPTLCDLAGLPKPLHLQGTSLVPMMRHPRSRLHEGVISQSSTVDSQMSPQLVGGLLDENSPIDSFMGWTMRTPRYRYTEWHHARVLRTNSVFEAEAAAVELYDYKKDPLERRNVAADPAYARILTGQKNLFDRILAQTR